MKTMKVGIQVKRKDKIAINADEESAVLYRLLGVLEFNDISATIADARYVGPPEKVLIVTLPENKIPAISRILHKSAARELNRGLDFWVYVAGGGQPAGPSFTPSGFTAKKIAKLITPYLGD